MREEIKIKKNNIINTEQYCTSVKIQNQTINVEIIKKIPFEQEMLLWTLSLQFCSQDIYMMETEKLSILKKLLTSKKS